MPAVSVFLGTTAVTWKASITVTDDSGVAVAVGLPFGNRYPRTVAPAAIGWLVVAGGGFGPVPHASPAWGRFATTGTFCVTAPKLGLRLQMVPGPTVEVTRMASASVVVVQVFVVPTLRSQLPTRIPRGSTTVARPGLDRSTWPPVKVRAAGSAGLVPAG